MKTQYYTASSLDGFVADADNSLDWLLQFGEVPEGSYPQFISEVGALAMGSTTYEWILNHHKTKTGSYPPEWMYQQPTWVFSSRVLPVIEKANIHFVNGDVGPVHAEMARVADGKNIWLVGGGDLARPVLGSGLAGRNHCYVGFSDAGRWSAFAAACHHESASQTVICYFLRK